MARPLRIEYEGAWYHVMNRGANHDFIFRTLAHRQIFLALLEEIVERFAIEIHGYCLMGNHYHLLIRTPHANLSRAMRHLDGVYTQKFNLSEKKDGALLRGRYKAILVEEESYLLQVSRYIHLNPIEAKICNNLLDYPWSSYHGFILTNKKTEWLTIDFILDLIGGVKNYIDFLLLGIDDELKDFYNKKYLCPILGRENFKQENILKLNKNKSIESNGDINRIKLVPDINSIMKKVSEYFNVQTDEIMKTIRGQINLPRLFVLYLSVFIGQCSYKKLAMHFKITSEGVRSSIKRLENLISQNVEIKNALKALMQELNTSSKAQAQT